MKKLFPLFTACAALFLLGVGVTPLANATLFDRSGGLLYDDVLNVTWLQDANYAKTSGYDADGMMTWSQATTWAANLSYFNSVHNVTYDDWRLASTLGAGRPIHYSWWYGVPDDIPNVQTEFSVMFSSGQNDIGLVKNLPSGYYVLGGTSPDGYMQQVPWSYLTTNGEHYVWGEYASAYAWAVRPGDIAYVPSISPVPEPETYTMLLAGLGLMGFVRRRRENLAV